MDIKVKFYNGSKYLANSKKFAETVYKNASFEVKMMSFYEAITLGYSGNFVTAEPEEYLVVTREDGKNEVYRNDRVDVFRY